MEMLYFLGHKVYWSTRFSWWYPPSTFMSLVLVPDSTITLEYKPQYLLHISPCDDQAWTPNTAYTEFCIHQGLHTPSTVYSAYWMLGVVASFYDQLNHAHSQTLISWLIWLYTTLYIPTVLSERLTILSVYWQVVRVPNWYTWCVQGHVIVHSDSSLTWSDRPPVITVAFTYTNAITRLQVWNRVHPIRLYIGTQTEDVAHTMKLGSHHTSLLIDYLRIDDIHVLLQFQSIMASKCISNLAELSPASATPISLDPYVPVHLCVHVILAARCNSTMGKLWTPSVSPNSLEFVLQLGMYHHKVCVDILYITTFTGISMLTPFWPPIASPHPLTRSLQSSISEFHWSWPASVCPNSHDHGLHVGRLVTWPCIFKPAWL